MGERDELEQFNQCVSVFTWSTDGGFDSSLFQCRNSVDGPLNVLHENVPVQIKQTEGKFVRHLYDQNIHVTVDLPPISSVIYQILAAVLKQYYITF